MPPPPQEKSTQGLRAVAPPARKASAPKAALSAGRQPKPRCFLGRSLRPCRPRRNATAGTEPTAGLTRLQNCLGSPALLRPPAGSPHQSGPSSARVKCPPASPQRRGEAARASRSTCRASIRHATNGRPIGFPSRLPQTTPSSTPRPWIFPLPRINIEDFFIVVALVALVRALPRRGA